MDGESVGDDEASAAKLSWLPSLPGLCMCVLMESTGLAMSTDDMWNLHFYPALVSAAFFLGGLQSISLTLCVHKHTEEATNLFTKEHSMVQMCEYI